MRMDNQSGRFYGFQPKTRIFGANPSGSVNPSGVDPPPAPPADPNADAPNAPTDAELIAGVITQGATIATHVIDGMTATQQLELRNAAAARRGEIDLQIAQANAAGDHGRVADLQAANANLQALIERTTPKNNTMLYVGLGVGGLVLVGGLAFLLMKRNNPDYSARANVVVTGSTGKKRFVTAAKRRRQLSRKRRAA